MSKQDDNIVAWYTTSTGKHIPIHEGESKSDDVAKHNADVKKKQIAQNKEQADKLNGKSKKEKGSNFSIGKMFDGYYVRFEVNGKPMYVSSYRNGQYKYTTDHTYSKRFSEATAKRHLEAVKKLN